MILDIKYMDCTLECEFDYEEPDPSCEYNGGVLLESASINGNNIFEMLSDKAIADIEQALFERM